MFCRKLHDLGRRFGRSFGLGVYESHCRPYYGQMGYVALGVNITVTNLNEHLNIAQGNYANVYTVTCCIGTSMSIV